MAQASCTNLALKCDWTSLSPDVLARVFLACESGTDSAARSGGAKGLPGITQRPPGATFVSPARLGARQQVGCCRAACS